MTYQGSDFNITVDFYNGCKVEISGKTESEFQVFFQNNKTGELIHSDSIKSGYWTKPSISYYIDWKVTIFQNEVGKIYEEVLDLTNKDVLIVIDNTPIGDNIAWVSYVDEFSKINKCNVTFQCPFRFLFEKSFPNLTFVDKNTFNLDNPKFYASYKVSFGIDSDVHKNLNQLLLKKKYEHFTDLTLWNKNETPEHPSLIPLQKFASNTLGLEWKEIRPKLICDNDVRPIEKKYICISEFASGKIKEWNNQVGWQTLVDELNKLGYIVVSISKEKSELKRINKRNGDYSLEDRMWYLHHCEFFIGVSSGLAWLAWGCNKKVVLISGVTKPTNEFTEDCLRIYNENVCHGCWNIAEHADKFAVFKSTFCPEKKNWECSRKISPKMVLEKMKEFKYI